MGRRLRSKRLRVALWLKADGRCEQCGRELPADWHADHIDPWVRTHRTNVHEMQALCPACNIKKGASVLFDQFELRTHQRQFLNLCRRVAISPDGKRPKSILASVTPGGGKSMLPVIAAAELIRPGLAEKICWVVPRLALQEQAEWAFMNSQFRSALMCAHSVRVSTNDVNPCRDLAGYVTTFQALAQDSGGLNRLEFDRRRYILVVDEVHHAWDGGNWHAAVKPLVDRAWLVIFMSGSLCRHDGKKIAFLDYSPSPDGEVAAVGGTDETPVVRYTRGDAIQEKAVIQLHVEHLDARAEWIDRQGDQQSVASFDDAGQSKKGDALYTALRTDFAFALLDRAASDWSAYRANANRRSKLLVVAYDVAAAKTYCKFLRDRGVRAGIATYDPDKGGDSDEAMKAIRQFREHRGGRCLDALVTVLMAYEGLDVPSVTHIACLTHIRSYPWIEQMLARATRFDRDAGPWHCQFAHAFVPDDPDMRAILDKIKAEQIEAVRAMEQAQQPDGGGELPDDAEPTGSILPEASDVTRQRVTDMGSSDEAGFGETAAIRSAMERQGIGGVTVLQIKNLMLDIGAGTLNNGAVSASADEPLLTPSQREANLRNNIQKFCTNNDRRRGWDWGETNRRTLLRFNKSRSAMSADELAAVWAWLQQEYGELPA